MTLPPLPANDLNSPTTTLEGLHYGLVRRRTKQKVNSKIFVLFIRLNYSKQGFLAKR